MISKIKPIRDKGLKRWIWQGRDKNCIFCGANSQDPHHVIRQSHKPIDLQWNLVGVCRSCHASTENGIISKYKEVKAVNHRLNQLGLVERFRTDGKRIRLDIGSNEYKYL